MIGLAAVRISRLPPDREHPYGHRKFETIAVFALAALLAVLAFELVVRALTREVTEIATGRVELALMLGVLATPITSYNVCYTKLLRVLQERSREDRHGRRFAQWPDPGHRTDRLRHDDHHVFVGIADGSANDSYNFV